MPYLHPCIGEAWNKMNSDHELVPCCATHTLAFLGLPISFCSPIDTEEGHRAVMGGDQPAAIH